MLPQVDGTPQRGSGSHSVRLPWCTPGSTILSWKCGTSMSHSYPYMGILPTQSLHAWGYTRMSLPYCLRCILYFLLRMSSLLFVGVMLGLVSQWWCTYPIQWSQQPQQRRLLSRSLTLFWLRSQQLLIIAECTFGRPVKLVRHGLDHRLSPSACVISLPEALIALQVFFGKLPVIHIRKLIQPQLVRLLAPSRSLIMLRNPLSSPLENIVPIGIFLRIVGFCIHELPLLEKILWLIVHGIVYREAEDQGC